MAQSESSPGDLILAIEGMREVVAAHTELREMYVNSGWSPSAAEMMVHAIVMSGVSQAAS